MPIVETIARIRRAYFGQGKSIKAICREFRASRKAVRKVKPLFLQHRTWPRSRGADPRFTENYTNMIYQL